MSPYEIIRSGEDLSRTLKERRKGMSVNQEDLASLNGMSRYTIIDAESGKGDPKLSTLLTLLEGVGLSLVAVPTDMVNRISIPDPETPDVEGQSLDGDWDIDGGFEP